MDKVGPLGHYLGPQEGLWFDHSCLWHQRLSPLLTSEMEGVTKRRQDNRLPVWAPLYGFERVSFPLESIFPAVE